MIYGRKIVTVGRHASSSSTISQEVDYHTTESAVASFLGMKEMSYNFIPRKDATTLSVM